jgi:hypothetical protein
MKGQKKMASDRQRLLELALETLENKRKAIEAEIEGVTRQLRGAGGKKASSGPSLKGAARQKGAGRRRVRFSREERMRRAARMKAYWENWRKQKAREKK